MKQRMTRVLALGLVASVSLGAACSSGGDGQTASPEKVLSIDRARIYESVADISEESTLVARVTILSSSPTAISDIAFTRHSARVDEVLAGEVVQGEIVTVRQAGDASVQGDHIPILEIGSTYVLLLVRHTDPRTGELLFLPTGATGVFAESNGTLRHLDPESALPPQEQVVSLDDFRLILSGT